MALTWKRGLPFQHGGPVLEGAAASRPAAASATDTIYFASDTGVASYSDGATWSVVPYSDVAGSAVKSLDGGGGALTGDVILAAGTNVTLGQAGQTVTINASGGGTSDWTTVTKAADESVTSSTVLQADDELFFTATSSGVYEVELALIYGSPAGAGTPDIKVGLGEDATTRGLFVALAFFTTADALTGASGGAAANQVANLAVGTAAANRLLKLVGSYVGNGGTFAVLWAQNTSGVNATIVRAGSVLRYRHLA